MAIKAQKDEQATLQQINDWLIQNFLFFRGEYIGWKNSVRHNLSLNDCFVKILRDPSRPWGKDNYWRISPDCNYSFKDGIFRRRKKQTKEVKKSINFSIDYILSLPSGSSTRASSPDSSIGDTVTPPVSPTHQSSPVTNISHLSNISQSSILTHGTLPITPSILYDKGVRYFDSSAILPSSGWIPSVTSSSSGPLVGLTYGHVMVNYDHLSGRHSSMLHRMDSC